MCDDDRNYANAILKIASQMKHGKKDEPIDKVEVDAKSNEVKEDESFNPFEVDDDFDLSKFPNPSKDEIVKLLKRKYIANLKRLKPFVDAMKYKTSSKGVSICPISCESKFFNLLCGNRVVLIHDGHNPHLQKRIERISGIGAVWLVQHRMFGDQYLRGHMAVL